MFARLRCGPFVLPLWFALTPLLAQRFAEAERSALPRECGEVQGVFVADFDGDLVPDLVLADARWGFGVNAPRLLRGDGRGAWTVARRSAFDIAIGIADVDGDGDRDLVFGQLLGGQLLRRQGAALVADAAAFDARGRAVSALALADLDGDGDLDLVQGNREALGLSAPFPSALSGIEPALLWNDGTGTFRDAARSDLPARSDAGFAAVGDLDGDALPDVVLADAAGLTLRNRGDGSFDRVVLSLPASGRPALADLDGDSRPDLVLLASDGRFWSFTNLGNGTFAPRSGPHQVPVGQTVATDLELGDFDGDGRLDVFVSTGFPYWAPFPIVARDALWLGQQGGGFVDASPVWCTVDSNLTDAAVGDLDGDGDLDVVAPGTVLRNVGGTFTYASFPVGSGIGCVALGDLDGDGDLDLAIGNRCALCGGGFDNPPNTLHTNNGAGGFGPPLFLPATDFRGTWAVVIRDVDGDGDRDVLFGNGADQEPGDQLVLNLGGGQWNVASGEFGAEAEDTRQLLVADLDVDDDLDVIAINRGRDATGSPRSKVFVGLGRQLRAPYAARLGRDYRLQAHIAPFGAAVWIALQPANLPLPPFGRLGLDPASAQPFVFLPAPTSGTTAAIDFVLPGQQALVGLPLYLQALEVGSLRLTNALHEVLVGW